MVSLLSFNFSVAGDKSWMADYNEPLQIMPQTTKQPTDDFINKFPERLTWSESVIHTSYITRPFNSIYNEQGKINMCAHNIEQYIKLCKRLKYKRLLIHLPQTMEEMGEIGNGFGLLLDLFNKEENKNLILVLEIPAFKKGFKANVLKYFKSIVKYYFSLFKNNNVEFCYDTAHLFANGVDCLDMINLFESDVYGKKLLDYAKIIHFNGNSKPQFKSDQHIQIYDQSENKLTHVKELAEYLRDKNKILITENTHGNGTYEDWDNFAKEHKINIVEKSQYLAA